MSARDCGRVPVTRARVGSLHPVERESDRATVGTNVGGRP